MGRRISRRQLIKGTLASATAVAVVRFDPSTDRGPPSPRRASSGCRPWTDRSLWTRPPGRRLPRTLTRADIGIGPILLYPVRTRLFTWPLFRVPDEPAALLFTLLRTTANADRALLRRQLASNRALYDANRAVGGTWYPIGAIADYDRSDRRRHYGPLWDRVVAANGASTPTPSSLPASACSPDGGRFHAP